MYIIQCNFMKDVWNINYRIKTAINAFQIAHVHEIAYTHAREPKSLHRDFILQGIPGGIVSIGEVL